MKPIHLITFVTLLFGLASCNYVTESSNPKKYLTVEGSFSENLWGDKFNVELTIRNEAESTTYKDATIKITYYTKTNTRLHSTNHVTYEFFPPKSVKTINLKIDNYENAEKLGYEIVSAKSQ